MVWNKLLYINNNQLILNYKNFLNKIFIYKYVFLI